MDYYQKYLKYKNKYINLSNTCKKDTDIHGGNTIHTMCKSIRVEHSDKTEMICMKFNDPDNLGLNADQQKIKDSFIQNNNIYIKNEQPEPIIPKVKQPEPNIPQVKQPEPNIPQVKQPEPNIPQVIPPLDVQKISKQIQVQIVGELCNISSIQNKFSNIFDLDCILPTNGTMTDYIFNRRLSKNGIIALRLNLQTYYKYFYNYLINPLSNKNDNDTIQTIMIPIISSKNPDSNLYYGIVDYSIFANKLSKSHAFDQLIQKYTNIMAIINSLIELLPELADDKPVEIYYDKLILWENIINNTGRKLIDIFNSSDSMTQKKDLFKINKFQSLKKQYYYIMDELFDILESDIIYSQYAFEYNSNQTLIANNKNDVLQMIKNKHTSIIQKILDKFKANPLLTTQQIIISLVKYDDSDTNLATLGRHGNSVLICKFKHNEIDSFLCIRTEPHRHSNMYCRNSVRKAIRDIFSKLPNCYYLDYVINSETKNGLQTNEERESNEITKQNLTDFVNLPPNIKYMSPLQGDSGFCVSWTMYTTLILLLNKDKSFKDIGNYLGHFHINKNDPLEKHEYTLTKHIKLYRAMLYAAYIIIKKLNHPLMESITNNNDKEILEEIFTIFDSDTTVTNVLIDKKDKTVSVDQNFLDNDTHKCDDNLFNHTEFCNSVDISKPIPIYDENNCANNKLLKNGQIVLPSVLEQL